MLLYILQYVTFPRLLYTLSSDYRKVKFISSKVVASALECTLSLASDWRHSSHLMLGLKYIYKIVCHCSTYNKLKSIKIMF